MEDKESFERCKRQEAIERGMDRASRRRMQRTREKLEKERNQRRDGRRRT